MRLAVGLGASKYVCTYAKFADHFFAGRGGGGGAQGAVPTYVRSGAAACIMYVHACMYVCMYVCMHVRMHVCMYVRMYVCMHVCRYVCVYVCV